MQKNSIQFFGLPGSGKTTILKELVKRFPNSYVLPPRFKRLKRFALTVLFIFSFPKISFIFIFLIFKNPIKLWGYIFHLLSLSFATHVYVLKQKNKNIFLIDEGIAQRLLSVAPRKFTLNESEKYIKLISKINSPIILTSGGNFSRFEIEPDRMTSKRNILGNKYYKNWSENLAYNFNLLSEEVKRSGQYFIAGDIEKLHQDIQNLK